MSIQWRPLAAQTFVTFILAVAVVHPSNGTAAAQSLFQPATTADIAAVRGAAPPTSNAKRERLVRVDTNVLSRHVVPAGVDKAADRETRAKRLDGVVRLDLFPDASETFRRTSVQAGAGGGYIWEGANENKEIHEALLTIDNSAINGRVQLNDRLFKIRHVAGRVHRITELDAAAFPPEAPPVTPQNLPQAPPQATERDAQDGSDSRANTIIKVLIAYTANAQAEAAGSGGNIITEINQAIALANQAYARGGIQITLQLAGAPVRVVYAENANIQEDLENLSNLNTPTNAAAFNGVRNLRNTRKADLVSLFRRNDASFCGIAWFPGSSPNPGQPMPSAATRPTGYSVMNWTCVDNLSFHHELGHNQGIRHDRYVDNTPPGYNHGFVNFAKRQRTVMAYNDFCSANGSFCTRINWFSSATRRATGNVIIGNAANDNTRRLRETRIAISRYYIP